MAYLQGKERADYVQKMFDQIAGRYNLMNRLMTGGQDQRWRRFVVRQAQLPPGGKLLDLATGTGDIAFEALKMVDDLHAVGGDFSLPMMHVGQQQQLGGQVDWAGADALNLPFAAETFDAVTAGYLLRNVIDIPRTLTEVLRVLKPGGRLVVLDSSPPPDNALRPLIMFHLKHVIPTLGRLISDHPDAYEYLPESTTAFKTPEQLVELMENAGFESVTYQPFMFGAVSVHWGARPGA